MRIGSYQVLLELARGGMGKVYLARSIGPGGVERLVAIKRAHEHLLSTSKEVAERFLDEARTAALVHHANVVGVHHAGSDEDGYYLVLEYVEGVTLDGLIEMAQQRGARVPPQIVLRIVCDALAGLHAAHEATDGHGRALGILHRDVSAQNLLVGRDGVTRLSDFGIAKSALSVVVTDEVYVQGKLAYMSPEYLQRKPVNRTLDLYAMGVTLYLALSGDLPWPAADEAQLLQGILVQGVPSLSTRAAQTGSIGAEITAVVDRACHRDRLERFQTARAMLDALEAASRTIGGLARHVEVSEFVEELAGDEFRSRRDLIESRRAEPEVDFVEASRALPAAPSANEASEQNERADGWVPGEHRIATGALRRSREGGRPWRATAYVALAAAVLAIGIAAFRRGATRDTERNNGAPTVSEHASAAAHDSTAVSEPEVSAVVTSASAGIASTRPPASEGSEKERSPEVPRPLTTAPRPLPARSQGRREKTATPGGVVPFSTTNPYR